MISALTALSVQTTEAIWGEVSMPGYGLYDRALGACYLNGLWEAIVKQNGNVNQK